MLWLIMLRSKSTQKSDTPSSDRAVEANANANMSLFNPYSNKEW